MFSLKKFAYSDVQIMTAQYHPAIIPLITTSSPQKLIKVYFAGICYSFSFNHVIMLRWSSLVILICRILTIVYFNYWSILGLFFWLTSKSDKYKTRNVTVS